MAGAAQSKVKSELCWLAFGPSPRGTVNNLANDVQLFAQPSFETTQLTPPPGPARPGPALTAANTLCLLFASFPAFWLAGNCTRGTYKVCLLGECGAEVEVEVEVEVVVAVAAAVEVEVE